MPDSPYGFSRAPYRDKANSSSTGVLLCIGICLLGAILLTHALRGAIAGQRISLITIQVPQLDKAVLPGWLLYGSGSETPLLTLTATRDGIQAAVPPPLSALVHVRGLDEDQPWRRLDHIRLSAGMRVQGAGLDLTVTAADNRKLELLDQHTGRRAILDAATRVADLREEDVDGECPEAPGMMARWFADIQPPLLGIGGTRACGPAAPARWPMEGLSPRDLSIRQGPEGFRLERHHYEDPIRVVGQADQQGHALMDMLRVGGQVWRVQQHVHTVQLIPVGPRFFVAPDRLAQDLGDIEVTVEPESYPAVDQPGTVDALTALVPLWAAAAGMGTSLVGLVGLSYLAWQRGWRMSTLYRSWFLGAGLIPILGVAFLARVTGLADAALELTLTGLVWCLATMMMAMSGRLNGLGTPLWCGLLVAVVGSLLVQLQLCTGATNDQAAMAYRSHLLFIGMAGIGSAIAAVPERLAALRLGHWLMTTRQIFGLPCPPVILLSVSLTFPMVLLMAFGSEQGLWGVQPSELAKFATPLQSALLSSWLIVALLHGGRPRWGQILIGWLGAYLVPIGFTALSLMVVHDMSPAIIAFLTMALTMGFLVLYLFWLAARNVIASPGRRVPAILGSLVLLAGAALVLVDGRDVGAEVMNRVAANKSGTLYTRVAVMLNPDAYPYSGAQYLAARRVIQEAPLLPDPAAMTGRSMVQTRIPLAKNDMVTGYFISRNGVMAAALLIFAQTMVVMALAGGGLRLLPRSVHEGEVMDYYAARALLGMLAISTAIAMALQNIINVSNVIGTLPIMGQSLMLVSTGGSNILLFALPAIIVGIHVTGLDTD